MSAPTAGLQESGSAVAAALPYAARSTGVLAESLGKGEQHLPALDGLRGIAILAVLLLHATAERYLTLRIPLDAAIFHVTRVGWVGVDLFFVLSGFLITGILIDARGRPRYFRSFYARRTLRIFPVYYAALLLITVILPMTSGLLGDLTHRTAGAAWVWTYLTNVRLARSGLWSSIPILTVPYWSLAVEEQFYLVWPLIVWCSSPVVLRRVCISLLAGALALRIALVLAGANDLALYTLMPTRLDTLAAGALLAVWSRSPGGLAGARRVAPATVAVGALATIVVAVIAGGGFANPLWETIGFSILAIGFAGLLTMTLARPPALLNGVLTQTWLRYAGRRSYAMYVLHYPIVVVLSHVRVNHVPLIHGSGLLRQATAWLVVGGMTVLAAEISWQLWERHWLALKRFVPRPTSPA